MTGQGFNAVKLDPGKPARTIRRNYGNLGRHGAMHWEARRRVSLPEFKRCGSVPDAYSFAGQFDEGMRQIGNSEPPLFVRATVARIRENLLTKTSSAK